MISIASIAIGVVIGAITTSTVFFGVDFLSWIGRRRVQRINMPRGRVVHLEGWRRR